MLHGIFIIPILVNLIYVYFFLMYIIWKISKYIIYNSKYMFKYICENRNLYINTSFLVTVTSLKYVLNCILYKYISRYTNENVTQSRCSQICTNLKNKLLFLSDWGAPYYIPLLFCFMYTFECLMINSTLKSTEGE